MRSKRKVLRRSSAVAADDVNWAEAKFGPGAMLRLATDTPDDAAPMGYDVPIEVTWYVVGPDGSTLQMVTDTPRGLSLGWDTCEECKMTIRTCTCRGGVRLPDYVRHVYVKDGGTLPDTTVVQRKPLSPREALDAMREAMRPPPPRVLTRVAKPKRGLKRAQKGR